VLRSFAVAAVIVTEDALRRFHGDLTWYRWRAWWRRREIASARLAM